MDLMDGGPGTITDLVRLLRKKLKSKMQTKGKIEEKEKKIKLNTS